MNENSPNPTSNQTPAAIASGVTKFLNGFNQASTAIQWVVLIAMTIGGYWLYTRDMHTVSAQTIKEIQNEQKLVREYLNERRNFRDKQFEELKSEMMTREVFDVYMKTWTERQNRQEDLLNKILENQHK